jgi:glutamyl-tRNA reductase
MRERFWISEPRRGEALHHLVRSEGIDEVVVLATGNRTEFILWAGDVPSASNSVLRFLTQEYQLTLSEWAHFYRLMDDVALLHIFRVAAGVEAFNAREPNLFAEISDAWTQSKHAGYTGRFLDSILKQALTVASRLRTEVRPNDSRHGQELNSDAACATAERVLTQEVHGFLQQLTIGKAQPAISAVRRHLDELCGEELEVLREEFGPFTADQEQVLAAFAAHIKQRIASSLAREFKEFPDRSEPEVLCAALHRLLGMEREPSIAARARN